VNRTAANLQALAACDDVAGPPTSPRLDPAAAALSRFVETSTSAMVMTDRSLRIVSHSTPWADLLGVAGETVIGRSLHDLSDLPREHADAVYGWALQGNVGRGERMELRRRSGGRVTCDAELAAWYGADGEVGGVVNTLFPVAEAVAASDAQRRTRRRLELAARQASLHIWELDFTRASLETNEGEDGIFDRAFSYAELIADPLITCHPEDRERVAAESAAAAAAGAPRPIEHRVNRADGQTVWVSSIAELVLENGNPVRLFGVMQNITARKLAEIAMAEAQEAAEAASRAKSAFLATVSHEIRTPMNGVLGMAQAMAADELSPLQRERLTVIRQSGESLLAVLNDVLDLSKVEAGKLSLEDGEFNLSDLARGAHAAFTAVANQKGLSFGLTIDAAASGRYRGDPTRIRQILYNLISNALKFTEEGEVRVAIAASAGGLAIAVSDTGIGIAPEAVTGLFQKFVQADASTTRRHGGTGLGLAICRELAQLMGGDIAVSSEVSRGSVFEVRLPLERLGPETVSSAAAPGPAAPPVLLPSGRPLRVLAAEDNTVNQLVLKTLLAQAEISPVVVENGADAVEAWSSGDWDVILMDVQMPVMDGPTAVATIRRLEAETGRARTPIVALTANTMAHQREQYLAGGMDAVVAKPLDISHLFATLSSVLRAGL